jgi:hypothetical protein
MTDDWTQPIDEPETEVPESTETEGVDTVAVLPVEKEELVKAVEAARQAEEIAQQAEDKTKELTQLLDNLTEDEPVVNDAGDQTASA